MLIFTGQTRASQWIALHQGYGFGEACQPQEFPPRRQPWFYDNRAFYYWLNGKPFPEDWYLERTQRVFNALEQRTVRAPHFVVCPDKVAAGAESLAFSKSWVPMLELLQAPLYLVVQNGMDEPMVERELGPFAGIFVGGDLRWKIATGEAWVRFAHRHGRQCHIGRVGTTDRVRWARRIGADSIDTSLPNWSAGNMQRFLRGFTDSPNRDLFLGAS